MKMAQAATSNATSHNIYELRAEYDKRQSFYGKAVIIDSGDALALNSYQEHVATYWRNTGRLELLPGWDTSPTTIRHVKEFAAQTNQHYRGVTTSQLHKEYNKEHQPATAA